MKRRLALTLMFLTLSTGVLSAEDSINPGKAPASGPSFSEQIVAMWDSFLGIMF